jgi:hypothetical protein
MADIHTNRRTVCFADSNPNCGSNCPANHTTVTLANLDPDERTDGSSYRFSNCCTVSVPNRSTHTCADIGANRSADS